jgi:alcohol dehydrogenase (cytochrome c)
MIVSVVLLPAFIVLLPAFLTMQSDEDGQRAPGKDWTLFGGDWTSARYSSLDQVHAQNVKMLGGAWMIKFEANASTRATPVVKDGVMFVSAGSRLNALDAKSGKTIWTWRPSEAAPASLETAGIGDLLNARFGIPNPPGVSLGEGLVFAGLMDGHIAALRQKTGEVVWTTQLGYDPPRTGQAVSGSPTYANGIVFAGLANGDWAFRGKTAALDAKTGKLLWEFYTIAGPDDPNHESWPSSRDAKYGDVWKQGGAGVWHSGVVDPDLGLVYFVTGNAVPMFGGEARKGDNLYTGSLLAMEMKTGKLRWHYQVVHHDLWDADIAIPPVLYDAQVNGKPRKAIAAMRADGYLFLLDRETGKPVHPVEERKVTQDPFNNTSPTQPFPVGADSLAGPCDYWKDKVKAPFVLDCGGFTPPFLDKHNIVAPGGGIAGTNRVAPMAYSPQTGYFYAQGTRAVGRARRITTDPWFRGNASMLNDLLPPSVSVIAAIDSRTNKIAWKKELPPGGFGTSGPLTTAGGLMFRGDPSGNFQAYDAKTGDLLWQFQTGIGGARGPAMSYAIDNEQYIAVAMGNGLWAFKLGGPLKPVGPPPGAGVGQGGRGGGGGAQGEPTDQIETATQVQSADRGVGRRFAMDEHAFNPVRARVQAGTWLMFINNGQITHTIMALDGSWTTGPLKAAETGYVKIDKPGTYRYACKEHPWAVGELTVQ